MFEMDEVMFFEMNEEVFTILIQIININKELEGKMSIGRRIEITDEILKFKEELKKIKDKTVERGILIEKINGLFNRGEYKKALETFKELEKYEHNKDCKCFSLQYEQLENSLMDLI